MSLARLLFFVTSFNCAFPIFDRHHLNLTHLTSLYFAFQLSSIDDRWEELQQTIQRLRTSKTEMIDMYRRARAQYVWHSGCTVLSMKGEVISKAEVQYAISISYHIISCHVTEFYIVPYDVISYHYHIIIISFNLWILHIDEIMLTLNELINLSSKIYFNSDILKYAIFDVGDF